MAGHSLRARVAPGACGGGAERGKGPGKAWEAGGEAWPEAFDSLDPVQEKVIELASRGFTLSALLDFFRTLLTGQVMPHFDPERSTTEDVVRGAVIPLSAERGCALANLMMDDKPCFPLHMVTHNWQNVFLHLVAAVVGHALGMKYYFSLVPRMRSLALLDSLIEALRNRGALELTYWICALSVNQHVSICACPGYLDVRAPRRQVAAWLREGLLGGGGCAEHGIVALEAIKIDGQVQVRRGTPLHSWGAEPLWSRGAERRGSLEALEREVEQESEDEGAESDLTLRFCWGRDSVTQKPFEACKCGTENHQSGPSCEMDKFREMIRYLKRMHGERFGQVIAFDRAGCAVTRAWVVAEIFEVYEGNSNQKVGAFFPVPLSEKPVRQCLCKVKLQDCEASVPEDKENILSSIKDIEGCNRRVTKILYKEAVRYYEFNLFLAMVPIATVLCLAVSTFVVWKLSARRAFLLLFCATAPACLLAWCLMPLSLIGDAYISLLQALILTENGADDELAAATIDLAPRFWWNKLFLEALKSRRFRYFLWIYLRRIRWAFRLLALPLVILVGAFVIWEFAVR